MVPTAVPKAVPMIPTTIPILTQFRQAETSTGDSENFRLTMPLFKSTKSSRTQRGPTSNSLGLLLVFGGTMVGLAAFKFAKSVLNCFLRFRTRRSLILHQPSGLVATARGYRTNLCPHTAPPILMCWEYLPHDPVLLKQG